jgi:hypothetical protein
MAAQVLSGWPAIAAAVALAWAAPARLSAASPELPADIGVARLSGQTRVNGLAIQILMLSASATPDEACAKIAASWQAMPRAAVASCRRIGPWVLINRREGSRLQAVQLRFIGTGTTGFYSELDLTAQPARLPVPRLPIPAGAQLVNVVESADGRSDMRQFTFHFPLPPRELVRRLGRAASERGWKSGPAAATLRTMLDLERDGVDVRAVIAGDQGGSSLVLLEICAPKYPS